ncbi:PAS domain-containing protein [Candidatus Saccharibacteria bacterium]|nr:PAS domain-containing protein [Candidatus Saccharibacteria bacterium]
MLNIFGKKNQTNTITPPTSPAPQAQTQLAEVVLNNINDGVIIIDHAGIIQFINPAAVVMTNCQNASNAVGLDYSLILKIKSKDGRELTSEENPLTRAITSSQALEGHACLLVSGNSGKVIPVSITMLPVQNGQKIITFRNIEKELTEESEQAEFISTASHEMRTPVATIDGYLALCLNPQTATIDERARGYLDSAKKASEHLGKLFQDLLDVTKLDDGRIRPNFVPAEMMSFIKQIATDHAAKAGEKKINYSFGANNPTPQDDHRLEQVVYASIDVDFMREIMDNLIDNAIKYTPSGGSIYINVLGDGDRVLINVTDTGIGISAEDLQHVFQKFYRADNSDTREIGGTGLGLYLVKQRTEAMGGRVWAESAFGQGTTFYVSLPRITAEEYNKRMIAVQNAQMVNNNEGGI